MVHLVTIMAILCILAFTCVLSKKLEDFASEQDNADAEAPPARTSSVSEDNSGLSDDIEQHSSALLVETFKLPYYRQDVVNHILSKWKARDLNGMFAHGSGPNLKKRMKYLNLRLHPDKNNHAYAKSAFNCLQMSYVILNTKPNLYQQRFKERKNKMRKKIFKKFHNSITNFIDDIQMHMHSQDDDESNAFHSITEHTKNLVMQYIQKYVDGIRYTLTQLSFLNRVDRIVMIKNSFIRNKAMISTSILLMTLLTV